VEGGSVFKEEGEGYEEEDEGEGEEGYDAHIDEPIPESYNEVKK